MNIWLPYSFPFNVAKVLTQDLRDILIKDCSNLLDLIAKKDFSSIEANMWRYNTDYLDLFRCTMSAYSDNDLSYAKSLSVSAYDFLPEFCWYLPVYKSMRANLVASKPILAKTFTSVAPSDVSMAILYSKSVKTYFRVLHKGNIIIDASAVTSEIKETKEAYYKHKPFTTVGCL